MSDLLVSDDYAECLTGSGRGAVAVIRFRCRQLSANHPAESLFRSVGGKALSQCKLGKITYGDWRQEDVVVVRTAADEWEVSCHGGQAAVRRILNDLNQAGIQNTGDPNTVKVMSDASDAERQWKHLLLNSKTIATADLILSQPEALQKFVERLKACRTADEAMPLVNRILTWRRLASHLTKPWVVAIVGKPNAGKSSFLNAVVGYQRSIVFDQPGTTRDLVQCDVVIGGWPVQLVDTAGIRDQSGDDIEQQGIVAARQIMNHADLCILISDQHAGWSDEDSQLLQEVQEIQNGEHLSACVIHNKCDLPSADINDGERLQRETQVCSFQVSSTAKIGISEVIDWISHALIPVQPEPGELLPVIDAFQSACEKFKREQDLPDFQESCQRFLNFS